MKDDGVVIRNGKNKQDDYHLRNTSCHILVFSLNFILYVPRGTFLLLIIICRVGDRCWDYRIYGTAVWASILV